jgi:hypothetical protein
MFRPGVSPVGRTPREFFGMGKWWRTYGLVIGFAVWLEAWAGKGSATFVTLQAEG